MMKACTYFTGTVIEDGLDLGPLAATGWHLKGTAQQIGTARTSSSPARAVSISAASAITANVTRTCSAAPGLTYDGGSRA
jgi:hypothetical protein